MAIIKDKFPRRIGSSGCILLVASVLLVGAIYSSTNNYYDSSASFSGSLLEDCLSHTTTSTRSSSNQQNNSQVSSSIGDKWSQVIAGLRPAMGPYREAARNKLTAAIDRDLLCDTVSTNKKINWVNCGGDPFSDIEPFVPLAPPIIMKGNGEIQKTIMDPALMNSKEDCLLYAVGIGPDSQFEQLMAPFCVPLMPLIVLLRERNQQSRIRTSHFIKFVSAGPKEL